MAVDTRTDHFTKTGSGQTLGKHSKKGTCSRSNSSFEKAHARNATKPEVLSECCSCTSQRTDRDLDAGEKRPPFFLFSTF